MRSPLFQILFLGVLLLLTHGNTVQAATDTGPQFKDITITTSKEHLLLFGTLVNGNIEELKQALHNGIPMEFSFFVELLKTRKSWPDEELENIEFRHILKYDPLKENYQLEIGEQKYKKHNFKTLDGALKTMSEINGLKVIELNRLLPDNSYELRLKAVLYKKTLPMNLHYLIPFISMWNLETDWFTIEFTY